MSSIDPRDVLVLMACGGDKRAERMPLIDLYAGPFWSTLRAHRGPIAAHQVFVLSAKLGFVAASISADPYDCRMSAEKADGLIEAGVHAHNRRFGTIKPGCMPGSSPFAEVYRPGRPWRAVIVGAAGDYRRVFDSWLIAFKAEGAIAPEAPILTVSGGIGEQRGELGQHLRKFAA